MTRPAAPTPDRLLAPTPGHRYTAPVRCEVTINDRGAVTIPAPLRRRLALRGNDRLIAEATADGLLLRPIVSAPAELYTDARVAEFEADEAAAILGITPRDS